jgi:hypothetical protein
MRPSRCSRRMCPLTMQLSLLLPAPRVVALAPEERASVIAVLARLLLEVTQATPTAEDANDAS